MSFTPISSLQYLIDAILPVGKGDKLPIIPAGNRRQWVREDLGAH